MDVGTVIDRKRSGKFKSVQGWITEDNLRKFKAVAALKNLSVSQAVEDAVLEWIQNSGVTIEEGENSTPTPVKGSKPK